MTGLGDRVGVWDSDFEHVGQAFVGKVLDDGGGGLQVGVTCREEWHESRAIFLLETGEECVDSVHDFKGVIVGIGVESVVRWIFNAILMAGSGSHDLPATESILLYANGH